jgi:hypothetical protein
MAYIGKQPTTGDFVLLDSITTSATASYTMQRNSVNFEPQSANHMIVSLNGTIQAPVSSFTVSGSTLTFASALTSSDVIDFILVLGNVNDVGTATTVVDSAITKNKLNLISESSSAGLTVKGDGSSENGTIQLNCSQNSHGVKISSPDHSSGQSYELILPTGNVTADKFLKVASVSGSGTTGIGQLSFADAGGNAGTQVAVAGLSGNQTSIADNVFTKLAFNTDVDDPDSNFDTTNNRYIAPADGRYFFSAQAYLWGTVDSVHSRFYKNGSAQNDTYWIDSGSYTGTREFTVRSVGIFDLSANDYIELYVKGNTTSGTTVADQVGTQFLAFRLD